MELGWEALHSFLPVMLLGQNDEEYSPPAQK